MKEKNPITVFVIFLLTFTMFTAKPKELELLISRNSEILQNLMIFDFGYEFLNIFLSNTIVGFLLSFVGFISGGLITLTVLIYNFIIFVFLYTIAFNSEGISLKLLIYQSKHVVLEFYAFYLFSIIGFRGFKFASNIYKFNSLKLDIIPSIREHYLPVLYLLIAAIIESN